MSDLDEDFDAVKRQIFAEFAAQGFGGESLSLQKAIELREYAKAPTDLHT